MAKKLGFSDGCVDEAADQMMGLYQLMIEKDATTTEINPMVEVEENGQKRGKILISTVSEMFILKFEFVVYLLSCFSLSFSGVYGCQDQF